MPKEQLDSRQLKNHWHEIKSQVLSHWNKLSEIDVERTSGNETALKKLVKSKYGTSADFENEYERICRPFAEKAKSILYGGKTPVERDLERRTAADGFNEPDDIDEEGMTRFDDTNADYTGLAMSEAEMDASKAQRAMGTKPEVKNLNQNTDKKTAPDEFKPNQDPHSSQSEDITLGRSNSSANTTSSSALSSSGATKKL